MRAPYKGLRIPPDLLAQIEQSCIQNGVDFSDWMRQAAIARLVAENNGDPTLVYSAARALVMPMVAAIFQRAVEYAMPMLPLTYEEAIAQFGRADTGGMRIMADPFGSHGGR